MHPQSLQALHLSLVSSCYLGGNNLPSVLNNGPSIEALMKDAMMTTGSRPHVTLVTFLPHTSPSEHFHAHLSLPSTK